jgi:hypothetical protein
MATQGDFYEWRFAKDVFLREADIKKLMQYAQAFNNMAFMKRVETVLRMMKK